MPIIGSVGGSYGYGRAGGGAGTIVTVELWGAGGGAGCPGGWQYGAQAGGGGYTYGEYEVFGNGELKVITGRMGRYQDYWADQAEDLLGGTTKGGALVYGGGGGASNNSSDNRYSGGGGGLTGVWLNDYNESNCLAIAGGGGGGSASYNPSSGAPGSNNARGGAGGGIVPQGGAIWNTLDVGQAGYSPLPDGTTRKGVKDSVYDEFYQNGTGRIFDRYYGGTNYSQSYGGGGGGGWYGGDAGQYSNPNPYQMGPGSGGSGYSIGQKVAYPDWGMVRGGRGHTNWFSAGYFGVMTGAKTKLPNNTTYTFANMASPGANAGNSSNQIWLMIVEETSSNNFRCHWAGLFNIPAAQNGTPINFDFVTGTISSVGSRTVPATGNYYMGWLSGNGFNSGGNPASSLYGGNWNDTSITDTRTHWIEWAAISGGAGPSVDKNYVPNNVSNPYTVSLYYGGYEEANRITTPSGMDVITKDFRLYCGSLREPGNTSGNYPGGQIGYGAGDCDDISGNGRGYARITVDGTVYTYDYNTSGGAVQTITF